MAGDVDGVKRWREEEATTTIGTYLQLTPHPNINYKCVHLFPRFARIDGGNVDPTIMVGH
jgi:hypothetical protein